MQSLEMSSPEVSAQTLGHVPAVSATVTAGWFLRRIALWMLFVGLGIGAACVLYVAASKAEAESAARSLGTEHVTKVATRTTRF